MTHFVPTTHHAETAAQQMTEDKAEMSQIVLPLAPIFDQNLEAKVCSTFVKHLRHVPSQRASLKILSSIHYTADILGCSDAHVSKILVDYGLRAPRGAFPEQFLDYIDESFMRQPHDLGAASYSYHELHDHWTAIGEDMFAPLKKEYATQEYSFVSG